MITKYFIYKEFLPGSPFAWVLKLDDNDPIYSYLTMSDAEEALTTVQLSYPGRELRIIEKNVSE